MRSILYSSYLTFVASMLVFIVIKQASSMPDDILEPMRIPALVKSPSPPLRRSRGQGVVPPSKVEGASLDSDGHIQTGAIASSISSACWEDS